MEPWFFREEDFPFLQELETRWREIHAEIRILLADENLRQKLIKNGRDLVLRDYDWQPIARKMDSIFKSL